MVMYGKLFVILCLERKKYLLLFLFLVSAAGYLVLKQVDELGMVPETIEIPDIEIIREQEEFLDNDAEKDGLEKLVMNLMDIADENTEVYGILARDLYTFSSPFYQVSFQCYEVEERFFNHFKNRLPAGEVPAQGKKEVVAGYNAASFYHLEVGDVINEKLGIASDSGEYVLSWVLEEEDIYFTNGFYLLKENVSTRVNLSEVNRILIYVSGKQAYKKITSQITESGLDREGIILLDNYKKKLSEKNKPVKDMGLTFIIGFLLLELVYFYISKGMDKKAGILKAVGIPDSRVLFICGIGFGGLVIITSIINLILSLILFDIKLDYLFALLMGIGAVTFLILFLQFIVLYKRVDPSASLPSK